MADTVQVVFEAKDAASAVIQGLVAKMGTLGGVVDSAGQLFSGAEGAVANFGVTLATQVVEGVIAAKDAALELNDTVEEMQFLAGGTAEEASRLTNVFERFGISAQEATAATRQLTKDGLSPSIDTLARLSDQYNALSGPVEKNAFLMDHFGRAGFRMAEMMSRGGDALRGYADSLPSALIS